MNDNYSTPENAYDCLTNYKEMMEFLKDKTIWDPFYNDGSCKSLMEKCFPNSKIIHENKDFFKEIISKQYDVIISNPPFSKKKEIIDILIKNGKPFILLMQLDTLSRRYFFKTIEDRMDSFNLIIPKNINSVKFGNEKHKPRFTWAWFCFNCEFVDQTIIYK